MSERLTRYHEQNRTVQQYREMPIYEPCNYASNLAYYRVVTSICAYQDWGLDRDYQLAMAQAFTALTTGSAFWHGSHTYLGNIADNRFIDVVAFIAHQAMLENLNVSARVRDLPDPDGAVRGRNGSAVEVAARLADLLSNSPVQDWREGIARLDMPEYTTTFSGLVCTLLTIGLEESAADMVISQLMDAFSLPELIREFITSEYLPEIRNATADLELGILEKAQLELDTAGTLIKLIYAFLWQEYVLTSADIFLDPEVNRLGAAAMASVNQIADWLTSFPTLDPDLPAGYGTYPGDLRCNPVEPHSKWHVQSANGLMDLMLLADSVFKLTTPQQ